MDRVIAKTINYHVISTCAGKFKMPRKKRQTKKGPTVQFSTSAKSVDGKGSYESKLREWRKIRDNLETEGERFVYVTVSC